MSQKGLKPKHLLNNFPHHIGIEDMRNRKRKGEREGKLEGLGMPTLSMLAIHIVVGRRRIYQLTTLL
jgi:hypothetical protein